MMAWTGPQQGEGSGGDTREKGPSAATKPARLEDQESERVRLDVQVAIEWAHLGGD